MLEDWEIVVDVEQLRPGLAVVRVPLPVRVDPVNCYVGTGDDGKLTVIDSGIALGAQEVWQYALGTLGARPEDVTRIFITHFHPDHIGGAGPLARMTGAPVLATPTTAEQAPRVWGDEHRAAAFAAIDRHLLEHGFPQELLERLQHEADLAGMGVRLPERIEAAEIGTELRFAGSSWEVVATPGHADGHGCLFDRQSGELIAGDHLLERISPSVGVFPDYHPDPLGLYLESLAQVRELPVELVLPGHGDPFTGAAERCDELIAHHGERVEACIAPLEHGPRTAWQVSRTVFGTARDAANQRFALTETLAHLEYARARGRVSRELGEDGRWRYQG